MAQETQMSYDLTGALINSVYDDDHTLTTPAALLSNC